MNRECIHQKAISLTGAPLETNCMGVTYRHRSKWHFLVKKAIEIQTVFLNQLPLAIGRYSSKMCQYVGLPLVIQIITV